MIVVKAVKLILYAALYRWFGATLGPTYTVYKVTLTNEGSKCAEPLGIKLSYSFT